MHVRPEERVLDWVSEHDERSRQYGFGAVVPPDSVPVRPQMWTEGTVLDQGREGACVGYGWMAELLCEPAAPSPQPTAQVGAVLASAYYKRAQVLDEFPGEDYSGTSVLAGAKVMQENNFIGEYRWCFSVDQVRDAVITEGPVVIGIPWFDGMYETPPTGLVDVSGSAVGGHCITITGYHPEFQIDSYSGPVFRWRNSWGPDYGINGSAYVKYDDLASLLAQQGEACVPMQRSVPVFTTA